MYLWRKKEAVSETEALIREKFGLSPVIARCVSLRLGPSCGEREISEYLNPGLSGLHDPFLLDGMEAAVGIIRTTIAEKGKIIVYGDYDVDGITSSALAVKTLRRMGAAADWFIPNRMDDGYGLNVESVELLASRGYDLMITVDCGISAVHEIELAKKRGMKVIVTDHHVPPPVLPDADALINPKLGSYPFGDLAGVGVAFKLMSALSGGPCEDMTDLAALGTVADIVPLTGENRILVSHGLSHIRNKGIKKLAEKAGMDWNKIDPGSVSFRLAPRINSQGRLDDATGMVRLLVDEDDAFMDTFLDDLERMNDERKKIANVMTDEAVGMALNTPWEESYALVFDNPGWHHGVLGIVASRIAERFNRPVMLIGTENGVGRGSARSIPSLDLLELLRSSGDLFQRLGGHRQAAGFTIETANIPELRSRLNKLLASSGDGKFIPWRDYDAEVEAGEIDAEFYRGLSLMEPFGFHNPRPMLRINGVEVGRAPKVVGGKHLSFSLNMPGRDVRAIGFGQSGAAAVMGARVDIIGHIGQKKYKGTDYEEIVFSDIVNAYYKDKALCREELKKAYLFLKRRGTASYEAALNGLSRIVSCPGRALNVFEELGIIFRYGDRMRLNETSGKLDLNESLTYRDMSGDAL